MKFAQAIIDLFRYPVAHGVGFLVMCESFLHHIAYTICIVLTVVHLYGSKVVLLVRQALVFNT